MSEPLPVIAALLRHLTDAGFDGVCADGEVAYPRTWSEEGIHEAGALLRRLHTATESFRTPAPSRWPSWWLSDNGPASVIGHRDAGPWNTVLRGKMPAGFVGWAAAGPVDPLDEVAITAAWHARLRDDEAYRDDLDDVDFRAGQVRHFLDGYGVGGADREGLVERMIHLMIRECADEARGAGITPASTDPAPLWALAWRARAADWMVVHRHRLAAALVR